MRGEFCIKRVFMEHLRAHWYQVLGGIMVMFVPVNIVFMFQTPGQTQIPHRSCSKTFLE